ncbi:hypothetical protein IEU95_13525 [Hoyosella rhizosphaerae]|uniref:AMIN-like domain-containing protein n=1 Tax=Hoyosella rhizosphaerae TaxID=1755582 RepID=A0A916UFH8_9ACTN|nr:hypothetical protein [Hoyosella rhizosphaerae]MBN4927859.1 hypothetical protein [Hoyosella rhizosphaerae]GGC70513.1 hypothetical protein GCM10011410_24220 [Hoyosella rhizosphaerae]
MTLRLSRHTLTAATVAVALTVAGCSASPSEDPSQDAGAASPTSSPQSASTGTDLPDEAATSTENVPSPPVITEEPLAQEPAPQQPQSSFDGSTSPQTAPSGDGTFLSVTAIRVGQHDGFSRVVIELDGQGNQPGFDSRYVSGAFAAGSGDPISVAGDQILGLNVTGWGYPFDTGVDPYAGPRTIGGPAGGSIAQVQAGTFFEGAAEFFIGIRGDQKPFRTYTLTNPTRVVVDISD